MLQDKFDYSILCGATLRNVGDFIIYEAIIRLMTDNEQKRIYTIETTRGISGKDIEVINSTKGLILTGSNLYRQNGIPTLTEKILDKIKVPVIPIGMGGQSPSDKDYYKIDDRPLRIIKKIHDKCSFGSVRDTHTYLTLKKNGIHNIMLTGCPALFHSLSLPKIRKFEDDHALFIPQFNSMHRFTVFQKNVRSVPAKILNKLIQPLEVRYNNISVKKFLERNEKFPIIIQQKRDFEKIKSWNMTDRVYDWNTASEFVNYLKSANGIYTSRLHGGMTALSYGVPATFFGIDSRIKSFCNMLGIEYSRLNDLLSLNKTEYKANFYLNRLLLAKKMVYFFELNNLPISKKLKDEITKHNI